MKPTSRRSLLIWLLYACVLYASLACSIGHGQGMGLRMSGISVGDCGETALHHGDGAATHSPMMMLGDGCVLSMTFSAILIAALFGLLTRLPPFKPFILLSWRLSTSPRQGWPPANPRASPLFA